MMIIIKHLSAWMDVCACFDGKNILTQRHRRGVRWWYTLVCIAALTCILWRWATLAAAAATINKNIRGSKISFCPKQGHTHWQTGTTMASSVLHIEMIWRACWWCCCWIFFALETDYSCMLFLQKLILQIRSTCKNGRQNLGEVCMDLDS